MKTSFRLLSLAVLPFVLSGCWTRIWTVAPTAEPVAPVQTVYTTTVTTPSPKVTTVQTITVNSFNEDISFYLDLQAVAAAFAEARTVQEFEQLLNSSKYMINNLDLNRDGYIDYLRVLETRQGSYHAFLIQACLAPNVFQDIATLLAERRPDVLYVEVIGDRYLYGYNYIVRPTFVRRPPLWDVFGRPVYNPWLSPYYYGYWPGYYTRPKPIYLTHYQAYVHTYMHNHHYCHHCDYPSQPFYNGYGSMTQPNTRHDYQDQNPNGSFDQRVTHTLTANGSGVTVRNAGELRTETQRQSTRTGSTSGTTERVSSSSSSTTRQPASTTTTTTRQPSSTSTTTRQPSSTMSTSATRQPSSTSSTSATRQPSSTSSSSSTTRQPSTSIESRVNKSGTSRTTIKTTDASGRTTTVKRTDNNSSRSTNSGSSTRSTSTRSGSSSSSTSTRTSSSSSSSGSTRR